MREKETDTIENEWQTRANFKVMTVKENVFLFRTRQGKLLTFGEPDK